MKKYLFFLLALFIFQSVNVLAGEPESPTLTLDRIFSGHEFRSERFGPARWLKDGTHYTTLEKAAGEQGGRDIIQYDAEKGQRKVLVPAAKLVPAGADKPMSIQDYRWAPDMKHVLIFTNTKRVWRRNTRGDYYLLDLKSWELHKLGGDAQPSTLMFATFSPDGREIAYVIKNNLYVEDVKSHAIRQLTRDGSKTIINGTFDWAYEEEFSLRHGFRWSPDSRKIAYWQLDAEGVGVFDLINDTDSTYSRIIPVQYPKAGTTNSACRVGVIDAAGSETTWLKTEGDPRNTYIARMEWAGNSREVVIQHLNRLQNTLGVQLGDAATGAVRTVVEEKDEAWVDVVDDLKWLADGEKFTWVSERDGWRHVYLMSRDGSEKRLVTRGEFDVVKVENIDERNGWLYYTASPDNPAQRYLYRTKLNGTGSPQRLTPADQPGTHSYQISPNAKWAIHTYSTFFSPPVKSMVKLPGHARVRMLVDNAKLRRKVEALRIRPEFFRVDVGDGLVLDGWMMKPADFDPSKKYPLLFYVYGEPAGQTVLDRWGGSRVLWHQFLTQQGYLVASVDNRGTPAPRGRDWRKAIYDKIGIITPQDQAAAAREIIRSRPYVDSSRVAVWGWSGGGTSTLNLMFQHPEIYGTGMAVAPVPDFRLYDTIYEERYMGLPQQDTLGYKRGSPVTYAGQLQGNLLLVHGSGDDNVHYQGSERLVNALIEANKQFSMMVYPNRSHGIYEGKNTRRHLFGLLTRYLNEKVPAGGRKKAKSAKRAADQHVR